LIAIGKTPRAKLGVIYHPRLLASPSRHPLGSKFGLAAIKI
jgi:hypothetical protein